MKYNKARQHQLITQMKKEELKSYVYGLIKVVDGLLEYVKAIPDDTIFPAMPGWTEIGWVVYCKTVITKTQNIKDLNCETFS